MITNGQSEYFFNKTNFSIKKCLTFLLVIIFSLYFSKLDTSFLFKLRFYRKKC
jgi:hypothetical protein